MLDVNLSLKIEIPHLLGSDQLYKLNPCALIMLSIESHQEDYHFLYTIYIGRLHMFTVNSTFSNNFFYTTILQDS